MAYDTHPHLVIFEQTFQMLWCFLLMRLVILHLEIMESVRLGRSPWTSSVRQDIIQWKNKYLVSDTMQMYICSMVDLLMS